MNRFTFILALFICLPSLCSAQDNTALSAFSADAVMAGVYVEWTIKSGQLCTGTDIERRVDGESWVLIGTIDGVCGNISKPESYDFFDADPVPGAENEYRLRLGLLGYTHTVGLNFYSFDGFEAVLLQSLGGESITIVPRQEFSESTEVEVLDSRGLKVDSFYLYSEGPTVHDISSLRNGLYIVRVNRVGETIFTDRFVKF